MANKPHITVEELRRIVSYDEVTGIFTWLSRPLSRFGGKYPKRTHASWNSKNAGNRADKIHHTGYYYVKIDNIRYSAHRLAWLYVHGFDAPQEIDHINCISSDNRIINLRLASHAENGRNKTSSRTHSPYRGIAKSKNKWKAQISISGKRLYLGLYNTPEEAHKSYIEASRKYHGKFGRID